MMSLDAKVAVITGAASGIGKAIARRFAQAGAAVIIVDIDGVAAELTVAELARDGQQAKAVIADVTKEAQVEAAMSAAVDAYGRLDILVSNAGIQIVAPIEELAFADWQRILAVHLDGAFLTTRAALRQMYKQGGGSIIYLGSVHSKEASVFKAPYVTAKHGILGLAKTVAKEGARHGVRANVICPGFVRTPLVDRQIPEQAQLLGISEREVVSQVMLKDPSMGNSQVPRISPPRRCSWRHSNPTR